jgi:predicted DNA-binding WGR domain protein
LTPSDAELGRIGTNGQKAEVFDTIEATGQAREAVASAKRRPGYRDL